MKDRRWRAGFSAAAALMLAVGCAVHQGEEVARYRRVTDLRSPEYEPAAPLTLRQALLLANKNNENLAIEGEDYLRTLIQRRRAMAAFLPTVDVLGTYALRDRVRESGGGRSDLDTFDVSADLDVNLFNGFRNVNAYWRDTFLTAQRVNDLLAFQEALLLDVAQVYYQVLRSEALVRVLVNSLAVQEERLRDTRGRFEAGVARPLDVAQTEAQAAATRTAPIEARRDVDDARALLVLLTAAAVGEAPLADAYALPARVGPLGAYLGRAEEARRELSAAEAGIAAARRSVEVAWGQYYPTASLNLSAFLYRESVPAARDWDALLAVNVPVFRAGQIEADVRAAWSFFREAQLVRSFLGRQVRQEITRAYQDLAASEARLSELRVQVAAAEQAYRQADASYRAGLGTNLERVAAQDALLEAQLGLASAEYDRKVVYLTLLRATGLLREELEGMDPPAIARAGADSGDAGLPREWMDGFVLSQVRPAATQPGGTE